ncbi:hypothetical protein BT96DRAFT_931236 [Gymnopus androsaceus JB14]|uniref:CCHC-type domain-containing protein n=1 Tax=Gymnopus androsaceus JB14 TaxID=1447944 RepID=A0A6A4ING6_9AGAR|nr:hypothetical protein BT96DRAFT_931236 [Gymnopus androsaceus JB14]
MAEVIDLTSLSDEELPKQSPTDLFTIDISPQNVAAELLPTSPRKNSNLEGKLLLPAHVSVLGSVAVEIIIPPEDQDYVEYLDYGGPDANKIKAPSITVCKRCGAKGEHKTSACPVLICLTCGVRNEHSTNSCPISKVCFACGMKGHLNASCPNRGKLADTFENCDRLSIKPNRNALLSGEYTSTSITTSEPKTLETRAAKKTCPIGQGGEGYIAQDIWCYNCGDCGHWGDDCQSISFVHDIPNDSSAFAEANVFSGPFYDIETVKTDRAPREWELADDDNSSQWNDWGGRVPINVGRQAKKKEMARMRERQEESDEDDRFTFLAKPMRDDGRKNTGNGQNPPSQPKKMRFGAISIKGAAKAEGNKPNLLARLDTGSRRWREDNNRKDRDRGRGDREREETSPEMTEIHSETRIE